MARTLANLKQAYNVDKLVFNMNPATNRAIASFFGSNGVEITVVTKPLTEFDATKEIFVYDCIEQSTGEIVPNVYILSNKAGKVPAFTL
jgi:hypothetical protein